MRFLTRLKFSTKLNLGVAAIIVLTSAPMAAVVSKMTAQALAEESATRGRVLAESLAARAPDALLAFDLLRLKNLADGLKAAGGDIDYVFIQNAAGDVLVHTFGKSFPKELAAANAPDKNRRAVRQLLDTGEGRIDDFAAPILAGDQHLGAVRLGMSRAKIQAEINRLLFAVAGVSGSALGLSVLLTAVFAGYLTRRVNIQIKDYQDQLIQAQKMESLGKLAGGVAHEINTPLSIILGYSQLLQEDAPEGGQLREDLRLIEKQAKICRKIVSDLLGFSRQRDNRAVEMDLGRGIAETVDMVRHTFYLEDVSIEAEVEPDMPRVKGDPEKLKQVWMNLLDNALDAMRGGGVIAVRCRLDESRTKAVVSVADTGSGIAAADLGKVFDPFFSTKPVGRGTGLGLSVSFGIVKDHGGLVRAESPLPEQYLTSSMRELAAHGPGCAFIVELPLDPTQQPASAPPRAGRAA
jgi:signal transduction histidine kinase